MARAGIGFGAGELFFAQGDFRLIPELDPVIGKRLLDIDLGGGGRQAELEILDDLDDRLGFIRLLEHRQHMELVLDADAFDVFKHRGAAAACELHGAGKAALAESAQRFNDVGGVQRDIVDDEIGGPFAGRLAQRRAVGEFHGVDTGAVQNQREE